VCKQVYYGLGENDMSLGNYESAVIHYEKSLGYLDSDDKLNEAMYQYVIHNKDKNNALTLKYVEKIANKNYKDSKVLYRNIFGWTATLVAKDVYGNIITSGNKLHGYYDFVLTVHGGEPDEEEIFSWWYYDENGNEVSLNRSCHLLDGESCKVTRIGTWDETSYNFIVYSGYPSNYGYKVAEIRFDVRK